MFAAGGFSPAAVSLPLTCVFSLALGVEPRSMNLCPGDEPFPPTQPLLGYYSGTEGQGERL